MAIISSGEREFIVEVYGTNSKRKPQAPQPPPLRKVRKVEFVSLIAVSMAVYFIISIIYMICG